MKTRKKLSEELERLEKRHNRLSADFHEFKWRIENPAKYKKGDPVEWEVAGKTINGVVSDVRLNKEVWRLGYCRTIMWDWEYTVIVDCSSVTTINEYETTNKAPKQVSED